MLRAPVRRERFDGDDETESWTGERALGSLAHHDDGGVTSGSRRGGAGIDDLDGQEDGDRIYGGPGNDVISAVPPEPAPDEDTGEAPPQPVEPVEHSYGGRGNDTFYAVDGHKGVIECGLGKGDTVYFDPGDDTVRGCENRHPILPL